MSFGGSTKGKSSIGETKTNTDTNTAKAQRGTSQLQLDESAIEKIIGDVLGSESGLASIFGGEQTAGLFDSSVAAQASGDLVANLVGELAKITGKTVTEGVELTEEEIREKQRRKDHEFTLETSGKFGL